MTGAPMQYTSKGCKNDNFQMSLLMFLGYRQNSSALWNITEYVGGHGFTNCLTPQCVAFSRDLLDK